jgi:hypothetical protein
MYELSKENIINNNCCFHCKTKAVSDYFLKLTHSYNLYRGNGEESNLYKQFEFDTCYGYSKNFERLTHGKLSDYKERYYLIVDVSIIRCKKIALYFIRDKIKKKEDV